MHRLRCTQREQDVMYKDDTCMSEPDEPHHHTLAAPLQEYQNQPAQAHRRAWYHSLSKRGTICCIMWKSAVETRGIHLSRDTLVVSVGCVLRTNARGILLGSTKVRRTHPTDLSRLKLVAETRKNSTTFVSTQTVILSIILVLLNRHEDTPRLARTPVTMANLQRTSGAGVNHHKIRRCEL